jgi:P-type conjugative transfer protein TrbJ
MKKITISTILAAAIMTTSLNAGSVGGFGGATEFTQILNNAELAGQSATQLQQYATQALQWERELKEWQRKLQGYQQMISNIGSLPQNTYAEFMQGVLKMKDAMEFQDAISMTASSFDQDFKTKFGTYADWLQKASNGSLDFQSQYKQLSDTTRSTVNGALKSLGLQFKDLQSDEDVVNKLRQLSTTANGEEAAIAAANQISLHQISTLKRLNQTILTQANMQGEFYAAQNTKEDLQKAQQKAFRDKADFSTGGNYKKNTRYIH